MTLLLLQSCQHNTEVKAQKAVKAHKRSDAASYNTQLGIAYLKQGDRTRAKKKLLMALELEPNSPIVNAAKGYFLEQSGELIDAKNYYQKALSLSPNNGEQLNNYGTFLCRSGYYTEAENYFISAVKDINYLNPAGAYENAGLCAAAIPDYAKAESYFIKALEADPQRKQSLFELVSIELKQNQAENALSYLQKYQAIALNDPMLLGLAVDAARKSGKNEAEIDYQQRLTRLNNITDYTGAKNEYNYANG